MRTRNQTKRQKQSSTSEETRNKPSESQNCLESTSESGNLAGISRDAVGKLLKRVRSRGVQRSKDDDDFYQSVSTDKLGTPVNNEKKVVAVTRITRYMSKPENCDKCKTQNNPPEEIVKEGSVKDVDSDMEDEMDDLEWEVGLTPDLNSTVPGLVIEFDKPTDSTKRKPTRRYSVEDKELAELVHKVHLLCLLGRGRLIDTACDDSLIQASLLSLVPADLLNLAKFPKLTAKALAPLVNWFHNNFRVKGASNGERPFHSALANALEILEGTPEEVVALSVALLRALNLTTRFVSILDVVSLKPDANQCESFNLDALRTGGDIFKSSTLMVNRSNQVVMSPIKHSDTKTDVPGTPLLGTCITNRRKSKFERGSVHDQMPDKKSDPSVNNTQNDSSLLKTPEGLKRKGDIEFEMQLEMALSTTAIERSEMKIGTSERNLHSNSSSISFTPKGLKKERFGQSSTCHGVSTATGSRKIGAPLYWAEVYCSGENSTGKWVHIDAVNAIIDGEDKVEAAAAACRTSLRYVVAFAGRGAKDVTRRYCTKWYKIASKRIDSVWWEAVLAPLKDLESGATGGTIHQDQEDLGKPENREAPSGHTSHENLDSVGLPDMSAMVLKGCNERSSLLADRTYLEDMELETRALTEPLPTNQQAYKNHPLYAIERWLTRCQTLYPKRPVLGFCSGHAVYPRTCVQVLHTKERWLREGLQVKINELPAKVLKHSHNKLKKAQPNEGDELTDLTDKVPERTVSLYGKWQTEPLLLPCAVDGIVPKNERGQVDVWSEKCLPPGTVHLPLPRVASVARRLEIDYAPAMVGFDFKNGRSIPVYDGIVVCAEFKDAIMEAYMEEEKRLLAEEKKRNVRRALSRWYQLLSSIVTRQRLNNCYGEGGDSLQASINTIKVDDKCGNPLAANEEDNQSLNYRDGPVKDLEQDTPQREHLDTTEDHEHAFFTDDESSGKQNSARIKRCRCGFSIEVEEL